MFAYIWPVVLVVLANTMYQICAKAVPGNISPFAALTVTYIVAAIVCAILYFAMNHGGNLLKEYSKLNWSSFVLGVVIIGLEVGVIYAYKAGWPVSTLTIVTSSILAVALIVVGLLLYKEAITWNKIAGIVICLVGLVFINLK
ncbi:MAG: EamA family transporter [Bacillota bacterium]|nr:EamA family transporter [Bacillota bacterium]MDO4859733.1 EamA family transporter [Bacillota bacterium]